MDDLVITVGGTKGGIGKTTSTVGLAHAAAYAGEKTLLLDADPQGSSTDWCAKADKMYDTPVPFDFITVGRNSSVRDAVAAHRGIYSVILMDTGPGDGDRDILIEALKVSTGCVAPSTPSPIVVNELGKFHRLAVKLTASVFVLRVACDLRVKESAEFAQILDEVGIQYFRNAIPRKVGIERAFRHRFEPRKLYGYQQVWREIAGVDDEDDDTEDIDT